MIDTAKAKATLITTRAIKPANNQFCFLNKGIRSNTIKAIIVTKICRILNIRNKEKTSFNEFVEIIT